MTCGSVPKSLRVVSEARRAMRLHEHGVFVRFRYHDLKSASAYRRFGKGQSAIVSGYPKANQIAVYQLVEKISEHSVTNRRGLAFRQRFRRKHWVFVRFVSVRLLRIPGRVLRFYYGRQKLKKATR